MDQSNQTSPSAEITRQSSIQRLMALSGNIAAEPLLYRKLAPNPYSAHARQLMFLRFSEFAVIDCVQAVILAEPEGVYDQNFRLLGVEQQAEKLQKQQAVILEKKIILTRFIEISGAELGQFSKELMYTILSLLVFETGDWNEAEKRYSQNQRRDLRLSIIYGIESTHQPTINLAKKVDSLYSLPARTFTQKTTWKQPLFVGTITALSIILLSISFFSWYESYGARNFEAKPIFGIEAKAKNQALPVRLQIPKLGIDATIEKTGVASSGEMEVPNNTLDVGWFYLGARPGEEGNAVLAGHFNGSQGEAGVFADLSKLRAGDYIYVEDSAGTSLAFRVRESRTYEPGYADDVFGKSDGVHLNLITCDGFWDEAKKTYSNRLVVFTDLVL